MKPIVLALCTALLTPVFAVADTFSEYLHTAERRGKGLVTKYFGAGSYVKTFEQVPGGAFYLDAVSKDGQSLTLYMLGDFETLIQGKLITPHIAEEAAAGGIPYLEQRAKRNKHRIETTGKIKKQVSKYSAGTAASLLNDTGFSQPQQIKPKLATPNTSSNQQDTEALLAKIQDLPHAALGEGEKQLFVFIDLNCPACQRELPHLKELAEKKSVSINMIPVAFVKPQDSTDKAIHLLTEKDPTKRTERLFHLAQRRPFHQLVAQTKSVINIEAARGVQDNNQVFQSLPRSATPYFVAQTDSGLVTRALTSQAKVEQLIDAITPIAAQITQSEAQPISSGADDI